MRNPKSHPWSGAGVKKEIGQEELEIECVAGPLFKSHVPMNLGHRVPVIERRFFHAQYPGSLEPDLLEGSTSPHDRFTKTFVIAAAHDPARPRPHELSRVLRTHEVRIEGVRSFLVASEETSDVCHAGLLRAWSAGHAFSIGNCISTTESSILSGLGRSRKTSRFGPQMR